MLQATSYPVKRHRIFVTIVVLQSFLASVAPVSAQQISSIARNAFPSTVLVILRDTAGQNTSLGSGFVVARDIVATNLHVVSGGGSALVKLVNQTGFNAVEGVVAFDAKSDLALLQVSGVSANPLRLGDDTTLQVGDTVIAIGNPLGLEGTVSTGIVSGIRGTAEKRLLQITAPISPGSSGGPVLNSSGDVVGISVGTYANGQNLNLAVPVTSLKNLLTKIGKPLPLSRLRQKSSILSDEGIDDHPLTDGIEVVGLKWQRIHSYVHSTSFYTFSFRNNLQVAVKNIIYIVIFYGSDDRPIHSAVGQYGSMIGPGLAVFLDSGELFARDNDTPPQPPAMMISEMKSFTVRVLGFNVVQ